MTEVERIMDQLKRAFEGPSWHGDSVWEILQGVTAQQAAAHPIPAVTDTSEPRGKHWWDGQPAYYVLARKK